MRLVLIHPATEEQAKKIFGYYELDGVLKIGDVDLYAKFGLKRAKLTKLLGPKVIAKGAQAVMQGHRGGKVMGDVRMMPGCFYLRDGKVVKAYIHNSPADRPDYLDLLK